MVSFIFQVDYIYNFNTYSLFIESIVVVIIPLMRRMGEQAIKLEDKTLPQLAQNWARISRNLSGKFRSGYELPVCS